MGTIRAGVSLQMGLVTCPVNVVSAVESENDTQFNWICPGTDDAEHAPSGVTQKLVCTSCSNDDKDTFVKGRVTNTSVTVVDPDEIARLTTADDDVTKSIQLMPHAADEVDAAHMLPQGNPYWLVPTGVAGKTYNTIVEALQTSPEQVLLCEWAARTKVGLFQVKVVDGALAMQRLAWPEAVKAKPVVTETPDPAVVEQMVLLMNMSQTEFDVANYRDKRRAALLELVSNSDAVALAQPGAAPTTDLSEQLAAAVAAASKAKAKGRVSQSKARGTVTQGKKTTAKKATAPKRTTAKAG